MDWNCKTYTHIAQTSWLFSAMDTNTPKHLGGIQKKLKNLERTRHAQPASSDLSWALYEVGKAYEELGDYHMELKYKLESLMIDKKLFKNEQEYAMVATSLNNVGCAYGHTGDFANELKYCLDALNIKKNLLR